MHDTRNLTKKQFLELAGVTTDDGWMTPKQFRQVTGLRSSEVAPALKRCHIGQKIDLGDKLYSADDTRKNINEGALPLAKAASRVASRRALTSSKVKFLSIRLSIEEATAIEQLAKHFGKSTADVVRYTMLELHKQLRAR